MKLDLYNYSCYNFMFCYTAYVDSLPLTNTPEVFGLHPNAEIGYYTNAAKQIWLHLMDLQPQTG